MLLHTAIRLSSDHRKPIIALTGAGGKSTLLWRLGAELAAAGRQVLLTTTTKLCAWQVDCAPFALIAVSPLVLAGELPTALRGYRQVLVVAGPAAEADKVQGLAPEVVCRLARQPDVEAVVVEADGGRGRPLKAPAGHEPVVPACATHVIVVANMAAVGRPLDEHTVHRPELAAALTGLQPGDPLGEEAVARLLAHPHGGLKGVSANAQAVLYLNLAADGARSPAEAAARLAAARQIAQRVLHLDGPTRYNAVLIGSAAASEPVDEVHDRVAGA